MELALTIKYLAKQQGIDDVDFLNDVILVNNGSGTFIQKWGLPFEQPTQQELELAEDAAKAAESVILYEELRKASYPKIEDQLDMIYWDQVNGTTEWKTLIGSIKTQYPKE